MKKLIGGLAAAAGAYALLRPWMNRWGTRPDECKLSYPGDDVVSPANYEAMMAVEVDAPPEAIWPWLLQLGRGRAGLYSYDWLDRLFGFLDAPSANTLLPEVKPLQPGDLVPIGKDPKWYYQVRAVEPNRALVMFLEDPRAGWKWSWSLILVPEGGRTRLLSRSRSYLPRRLGTVAMWGAIELPAFIMTRKMLLNLRDRAEGPARGPEARHEDLPTEAARA